MKRDYTLELVLYYNGLADWCEGVLRSEDNGFTIGLHVSILFLNRRFTRISGIERRRTDYSQMVGMLLELSWLKTTPTEGYILKSMLMVMNPLHSSSLVLGILVTFARNVSACRNTDYLESVTCSFA